MVAAIAGSGLGLFNSSLNATGAMGYGGPGVGQGGQNAYVNVATGNLVLQQRDELLVAAGSDYAQARTYNSQGVLSSSNLDNFRFSYNRRITSDTGIVPSYLNNGIIRIADDGHQTLYKPDPANHRIFRSVEGGDAHDTLTYYDATMEWVWTEGSTQQSEVYNGSGQLVALLDGKNTARYDGTVALGNLKDSDAATRNKTLEATFFFYNTQGFVTRIEDASGQVVTLEYAAAAVNSIYHPLNLVGITTSNALNGASKAVRYSYDSLDRLTEVCIDLSPQDGSIADNNVYRTYYTYAGNQSLVTRIAQSDGSVLRFTYVQDPNSGAYRVKTVQQGDGNSAYVTRYDYFLAENRTDAVQVVDINYVPENDTALVSAPGVGVGYTTSFVYDARQRLVQTVAAADASGQRNSTYYSYDADDNLVQLKDARGNPTIYSYDERGNQIEVRDAAGNVVQRQYNERNQLLRETSYAVPGSNAQGNGVGAPALPRSKRYVYDAWNRLRFTVDANGSVTENRYDDSQAYGSIIGERKVSTLTYTLNTFDTSALDAQLATYLAAGSAGLLQERWNNIEGDDVEDLTVSAAYPNRPDSRTALGSFEIASNSGNNYGTRVRGYLEPTVSGLYTFWIASNNEGELYLSSDANAANKVRIARVDNHIVPVGVRAWDMYSEQKSVQIQLEAGQRYYIETLQKENNSNDHLSVAWQRAGGARGIIGGANLAFNPAWVPSEIALGTLQDWAAAATAAQGIQRVDSYYDFRGQLAETIAYATVDAQGIGIADGREQVASYVYDQRGNLLKTVDVRGRGDAATNSLYLPAHTQSSGAVQGLSAEYFSDETLGNRVLTRTDATVDFNAGYGAIASGLGTDHVSARWTGYIGSAHQQGIQEYTFYVAADDGVRLWIDGQLIIDSWSTGPAFEKQGRIVLEAGRRYSIRLEYFEHEGTASAQLSWKTAGLAKQVVAPSYLFTADIANAETVADRIARGASAGLTARYYDNPDFTGLVTTRVDNTINFSGFDTPANQTNFSVRWQGTIVPAHGQGVQTYRFATASNDGIRVWIGNQLVIDAWQQPWGVFDDPGNLFGAVIDGLGHHNSGTIQLQAGVAYDIRVEYVQYTGAPLAKLYWSTAGLDAQLVSSRSLFAQGAVPPAQPQQTVFETSYAYDGLGRLLATTDALGQVTTVLYDDLQQRIITTRANGLRVTNIYDRAGALLQSIDADVSNAGAPQALGSTRYRYDVAGRLISMQDPTGVKTYYLYDESGRQTGVIDGNGILTETVYDAVGRIVQKIVHARAVDLTALNDWAASDAAIGYFAFDEATGSIALNRGSSGVAGAIGSGVTVGVEGRTNSGAPAYSFNGAGTAHIVVDDPALALGSGTIEAWLKTANAGAGMRALIAKEGAYGLFLDNNELVAYNYDANPVQPPAGLTAEYYTGQNFDNLVQTRIDATINFDAGFGNVTGATGFDNLSVRWTGKIKTVHTNGSQAYTFYADADDGMRVWIDGQLIIDDWSGSNPTQATVTLAAGLHDIRVEYREAIGAANAKLQWQTTGLAKQVVAQQYLLSAKPFDPAQRTGIFLNDNQWHHVAMVFSADVENGAKIYVDGKYVLTTTVHSAPAASATLPLVNGHNALWIGAREGVAGSAFNGLLDEVAIYDRRLSESTILAHAQDGIDFSKGAQWIDNPALYLRLDETGGALAHDSGKGGFNGSIGSGVQIGQVDVPPPVADPFAPASHAAYFDGSANAAIVVPPQAALQLESGTLEAWLKTGNAGSGLRTIAGKDGAYGLFLLDNELVAYNFNANAPQPQPGLVAQYYSDNNFTNLVATRVDASIDSPALGSVPASTYSVRWTGQIQTPAGSGTKNYTFYASADDGVRVWVNGQLIIDQWQYNGGIERTGSISLEAGKRYDVKVEYRKFYGSPHVTLKWSATGMTKAVVGSSSLYTIKQYDPFVHTGVYLNDNRWHDVQLQFNNNVVNGSRIFVDGQLVLTTTLNSGVAGKAFYVGGGADFTANLDKTYLNLVAQSFTGLLSNVAVYDHALTAVQIESHQTGLFETGLQIGRARPAASADDRRIDDVYDAAGLLRYRIDGEGSVEEFRYDGTGLLLETIVYDQAFDKTPLRNASGAIELPVLAAAIALRYPDANALRDSQSRVTRYGYDAGGRLLFTVDAENYLLENRYNAAGELVESIRYANPVQATLNVANLVDVALLAAIRPAAAFQTLPGGRQLPLDVHEYRLYDLLGQLVATIDGEGYVVERRFDSSGNLVALVEYATPLTPQELSAALNAVGNDAARLTLGGASPNRALGQVRPLASVADHTTQYQYDALGRQIREVDYLGTVTDTIYNAVGLVLEQRVNAGVGETPRISKATYDALGRQTASVTPLANGLGQASTSSYDAAGRLISTTDELGHKTVYYYDAGDRLVLRVNADGEVAEYEYNAFGEQSAITLYANRIATSGLAGGLAAAEVRVRLDRNAQKDSRVELRYNRRGQQVWMRDAEGYVAETGYDALADRRTQSRQINSTEQSFTTFAYNKRALLIEQIDDARIGANSASGLAARWLTTYDAFGRASSVVDPSGGTTQFYRDRLGQVIESRDALHGIRSTTYDAFARVLTQTDALGGVTRYQYDDQARALSTTSPEGIVVRQVFDRFGELISVADGRGNTTSYQYDANGNLLSTVDAAGKTALSTYDVLNRLTGTVDENGVSCVFTYDAEGRVLSRTLDPNGLALHTSQVFDTKGQVIRSVDALGHVTEISYDRNGQVVRQVRDPGGLNLVTEFAYDGTGNQVRVREGNAAGFARETVYAYDRLNRLVQVTIDPAGLALATQYIYDSNDNVVAVVDAAGARSYSVYDALNREIFHVDAEGGVIETSYDAEGRAVGTIAYANAVAPQNLAALATQPENAATLLRGLLSAGANDRREYRVYDGDGRVRYKIDGLGQIVRVAYDASGNIVQSTRYAKATLAGLGLAVGTLSVAALDQALAATALLSAADRTQAWTFDALDRVVTQTDALGNTEHFTYDALGNVLTTTDVAGNVTTYVYDAASRLVEKRLPVRSIVGAGGAQSIAAVTRFFYDAAGNIVEKIDAVGTAQQRSTQFSYDAANRLTDTVVDAGGLAAHTQSVYDSIGNVVRSIDANGASTYVVFDAAGRERFIVDRTRAVVEQRYNGRGEIVARIEYATPLAAGIDPTTLGVAAFAQLLVVDALHDRSTQTLRDDLGQVETRVDAAGNTIEFRYDAFGNAIGQTEGNRTTRSVYDALNRVVYRLDAENYLQSYRYDAFGNTVASYALATAYTAQNGAPGSGAAATAADFAAFQAGHSSAADVADFSFFDRLGREIARIDGEGYVTALQYDSRGNLTVETRYGRPLSATEIAQALQQGAVAAPDTQGGAYQDHTTVATYNALNQRVSSTDYRGLVTTTYFDGLDRIVAVDRGGRRSTTQYNALNSVTGESNALAVQQGKATHNSFDDNGRLLQSTDELGAITTYYYDGEGRMRFIVDALGGVRELRYNAFGETIEDIVYGTGLGTAVAALTGGDAAALAAQVAALANAALDSHTVTAYDRRGLVSSITDALGYAAYSTYDRYRQLSRVEQQVAPGKVQISTFAYDRRGFNISKTQDAALDGNSATGLNVVESTAFDAFGNAVLATDGRHQQTVQQFDRLGRVVHVIDALGHGTSASYDSFGRQLSTTDTNGNVTTFVYNDADNSVTTVLPTAAHSRIVANEFGEQVLVVDAAGNETLYAYDANGNLVSIDAPLLPANRVLYDVLNRVVESTDAKGIVTRNQYDALNRLFTQTQDAGAGGLALVTRYQYSEQGRVLVTTDANGIETRTTTDLRGAVVQIVRDPAGLGEYTEFNYDGAGNKLSVSRGYLRNGIATVANTTHYQYDGLNRLVGQSGSDADATYGYDANGNVVARTDGNGHTAYTVYDADNRPVYQVDPSRYVTAYGYDASGNRVRTTRYAQSIALPAVVDAAGIAAALHADTQHDQTSYALFDALDRKIYDIDPAGYVQAYSFDDLGKLTGTRVYANPIVFSGQPSVVLVASLLQASPLTGVHAQPGANGTVNGQDVSGTLTVDPSNGHATTGTVRGDQQATTATSQTVTNGVIVVDGIPPSQPVPLATPVSSSTSVDDTRPVSVQVGNASEVQTSYIQNYQYAIGPVPGDVHFYNLPAGVSASYLNSLSGPNAIAAAILQQPLQVTAGFVADTAPGYSFNAVASGLLAPATAAKLASVDVTTVKATIRNSAGQVIATVFTPLSATRTASFDIDSGHLLSGLFWMQDFAFHDSATQTFSPTRWNGEINLGNLANGSYSVDLRVDYLEGGIAKSYDTTAAGNYPLAIAIGTQVARPTEISWDSAVQPGNTTVEFLYGANQSAPVVTADGASVVSLNGLADGDYAFTVNYRDRSNSTIIVRTFSGVFTSKLGAAQPAIHAQASNASQVQSAFVKNHQTSLAPPPGDITIDALPTDLDVRSIDVFSGDEAIAEALLGQTLPATAAQLATSPGGYSFSAVESGLLTQSAIDALGTVTSVTATIRDRATHAVIATVVTPLQYSRQVDFNVFVEYQSSGYRQFDFTNKTFQQDIGLAQWQGEINLGALATGLYTVDVTVDYLDGNQVANSYSVASPLDIAIGTPVVQPTEVSWIDDTQPAGTTVEFSYGPNAQAATVTSANGISKVSLAGLADGQYTFTVAYRDSATNEIVRTLAGTFTSTRGVTWPALAPSVYRVDNLSTGTAQALSGYLETLSGPAVDVGQVSSVTVTVFDQHGQQVLQVVTDALRERLRFDGYAGEILLAPPGSSLADGSYTLEIAITLLDGTVRHETLHYEIGLQSVPKQRLQWPADTLALPAGGRVEFHYGAEGMPGSVASVESHDGFYSVLFDTALAAGPHWFEIVYLDSYGHTLHKATGTFAGKALDDTGSIAMAVDFVRYAPSGSSTNGSALVGYLLPAEAATVDYVETVVTNIDTSATHTIATYIDAWALAANSFVGNINLSAGAPLANGRYSVVVKLHHVDGSVEVRPAFTYQIGQLALPNQALTRFDLGAVSFPPNTLLLAQYQSGDGALLPVQVAENNGNVVLALPQLQPSASGVTDTYTLTLSFVDRDTGRLVRQVIGELAVSAAGKTLHFDDRAAALTYRQQLFRYDALGRKVFEATSFDASGKAFVTRYNYDANNQLVGSQQFGTAIVFDEQSTVQSLQHDLDALTAPQKAVTGYVYDNAGRVVQTARDGLLEQATFDAAGNRLSVTDANGDTTYFVYDANNRLTHVFAPVATHVQGSVFAGHGYTLHANDYIATQYEYDALDQVSVERLYTGYIALSSAQVALLASGQFAPQALLNNAAARTTTNTYNAQGLLETRVVIGSGNALLESVRYGYDGFGNIVAETQGYNTAYASTTQRTYDGSNRLSSETRGYGTAVAATTRYAYDAFGNVVAVTDARGNALAESDSDWARQTRVAAGKPEWVAGLTEADRRALRALYTIVSEYDARGFKIAETDMLGFTRRIANDAFGNPVKITAPDGGVSYLYYDAQQQLRAQVDARGAITWSDYDGLGQMVRQTAYANALPAGSYSEFTTLAQLQNLIAVSAGDRTTQWRYDAQQRIAEITDALGYHQVFAYDGEGNMLSRTDQENRVTYYLYDADNRKIGERSANLASGVDGYFTRVDYNVLGQATRSANIVAGTGVLSWNYDDLGQQTRAEQSNGRDTIKTYDVRGNVSSEADGNGNVTRHYYNALDQRVATLDAQGYLTTFAYDPVGNLLTQSTYAQGGVAAPATPGTQPTQPADGARVNTYRYDRNGQRTAETVKSVEIFDVASGFASGDLTTTTEYDAGGHPVRMIDANGNVTRAYYDVSGKLLLSIDAAGGVTRYQYDSFGNTIRRTQYDQPLGSIALGLLNNQTPVDTILQQLIPAAARDRVTEFRYDRLNRKIEERVVGVGYDVRVGSGSGVQHRAGDLVNLYEYDGVGNVTRLVQTGKATGSAALLADTDSNVARQETIFNYDGLNRLVLEEHPTFLDFENETARQRIQLAYDYNGNIVDEAYLDRGGNIGKRQSYVYSNGQLVSESGYKGVILYAGYDANGNVGTRTDSINRRVDTYTYDSRNQVRTVVTTGTGGATGSQTNFYAYDAFGQVSQRGRRFGTDTQNAVYQEYFIYDNAGRVVKTNEGDGVDRFYFYDRAGNRSLEVRSQGASLASSTAANLPTWNTPNVLQIKATSFDALGHARYTYQAADTGGGGALSGTLASALSGASLRSNRFIRTEQQYNVFGELVAAIDGRNNVTRWTYNTLGNRLSETTAAVAVYGENGVASTTTPTTYNYYDIQGRLVGSTDAAGILTWQTWADDQVAKVTRAAGTGNAAVRTTRYDALGDRRSVTSEAGLTDTFAYNYATAGQYTISVHIDNNNWTDGGINFVYTYQFDNDLVKATRSYGAQEQSFAYDALGRLTSAKDYWGVLTTYSYSATAGGVNQRKDTNNVLGNTIGIETNYFNRVVTKWDLSGRRTDYTYDAAGQMISARSSGSTTAAVINSGGDANFNGTTFTTGAKSVTYTYFTTGKAKQIVDTNQAMTTSFNYDANGNITVQNESSSGGALETSITYDSHNRVASISARRRTGTTADAYSLSYGYDAVDNRRFATGSALQVNNTRITINYWYTYDELNRLLINQGTRSSGTIVRGPNGNQISYDASGRRTQEINKDGTITYEYNDSAHTVVTKSGGQQRSKQYFDSIGQLLSTEVWDTNGKYVSTTTNSYTSGLKTREAVTYSNSDGYEAVDDTTTDFSYDALGNLRYSTNVNSPHASGGTAVTSTTKYSYILLDSYQQRAITVTNTDNTAVYMQSLLSYDGNGNLSRVVENEQGSGSNPQRTMSYSYDFAGNVTQRLSHSTKDGDRKHYYYYLDSEAVGDTGNDDTTRQSYIATVNQGIKSAIDPTKSDYKAPANTPVLFTDFDGNFGVSNPGVGTSAYTVLAGDTLRGIAQKVYGDAALWFLLADANGLTGSERLSEGQQVQIPNQVHSVHNTDKTYRPYDAAETVRDTVPDAPPPPKVDECKRIGSIIIAILVSIFVVVLTVITAGAATGLAAVAIGAVVGAVGAITVSAVTQGVNIALGLQKEFNTTSLAIDAIVGFVTGGLAGVGMIVSAAKAASTAARVTREVAMGVATGFVESTLRQGLNVALAQQKQFDWTMVALGTGIGAASGLVSGAIGAKLAKRDPSAAQPDGQKAAGQAKAGQTLDDGADVGPTIPQSRGVAPAAPASVGVSSRAAAVRNVVFSVPSRQSVARVVQHPLAVGAVADLGVAAGATAAMSAVSGEPFDFSYFSQMAISNAAGRGAGSNRLVQKAITRLRSALSTRPSPPPAGKDAFVLKVSQDEDALKTGDALLEKGNRRAVSEEDIAGGALGRMNGASKLIIPGHGDVGSLDGRTPKQWAQYLKDNGMTEVGQISLVACNSGAAGRGKKSFAEELAQELKAQGIAFKSISGREGKVAVLPNGRKVVVNDDGDIFSKGRGTKIVVRNQLDESGNFIVDRNPYEGEGVLRSDLDVANLRLLPRPPTVTGKQGDHTTAYSVITRAINNEVNRRNGPNPRANMRQLFLEIMQMPGHLNPNNLAANTHLGANQQRYNERVAEVEQEINALPQQGPLGPADLVRVANALERLENFNPLATVTDGSTGAGEGFPLADLRDMDGGVMQYDAVLAMDDISWLFDTQHADTGIQAEVQFRQDVATGEAHQEIRYSTLPGVRRGPNNEIDVGGTQNALAERHARFAAWAYPTVVANLGGGNIVNGMQAIRNRIVADFANGGDRRDSDYEE
jgi:YD repeat-containing protein